MGATMASHLFACTAITRPYGRIAAKPVKFAPVLGIAIASLTAVSTPRIAAADEGGIGFWLPGSFASLAAAQQVPGWAVAIVDLHSQASASGNVAAAREVTIGKLNATVNANLNVNLDARADLVAVAPSYVFATPVLGGQLGVSVMGVYGRPDASINGTLTASVGPLSATRTGSITDARSDFGDLYPQTTLRWNQGVNNFMVYSMGDIPVGAYDPSRLANLGIGHGAIDGGAGYTYLNPKTGYEFSVVSGFTYNFKNPSTDYQNGIDWHVDWGMSKFLTKQLFVGPAGYFYQQLTGDRGAPAFLGENLSRVAGVGPQLGYLFPVAGMQGFLNLKAYWEFDAARRADGWNTWVTFALSPAAPEKAVSAPKSPMIYK
jgi:hypothetical protein